MKRIDKVSSLLFLLVAALFSPSFGGDSLIPSQPLADDGTTLISAGSIFELGFFSPAGSSNRYIGIWYHNIPIQTVVWVANRNRPINSRSGILTITANGTLVITDDNSTVFWSSSSLALANPVARLLDEGNFIVKEVESDSFAWESFNFPTDTVLPGMKVGWNQTRRSQAYVTSWKNTSDPSSGDYVMGLDLQGDPQLFIWSSMRQLWRGGPWNCVRYSGIPDMDSGLSRYEVVVEPDVLFWYYSRDPSIISRIAIEDSGVMNHYEWIEGRKSWRLFAFHPQEPQQCDSLSPCGPYGVCYPNREKMCTCIQGFHPKNGSNWNLRDWSDGCVRNTALECQNGADGFLKQSNMKLPDTSRSMVDWRMSLEECRATCSKNCSCTAYASANVSGSASGCIMWTTDLTDIRWYEGDIGQDIYVRLAAADIESQSNSHHTHLSAIILVPTLTIFLAVCGACYVWRRKKREHYINVDEEKQVKDMDLPLYDLDTIREATKDFSIDNKLGQGGFGSVYKGKIEEKEIAVKRLSKTSVQGVDEFMNEVMLIAKLQHRNLVQLLGCCIQGGERILIYEYMPNGSLDAFLFDETRSMLLDWPTRYNITVGIARALIYLHQDSRLTIIHRDLKAGNVLLDEDMNPKISDFGMARIFGGEDSEVNTRRVVGTYGYMSPEYAMDGNFSVKSDVFSFGVLLLEIITSRKNRGVYNSAHHLNLLGHVWSLWNEDKAMEIIDKSIEHTYLVSEVLTCIKIGLLCVQEQPRDRPTMTMVLKMLDSNYTALPEPRQPGFVASRGSSTITQLSSTNSLSMTILEGR